MPYAYIRTDAGNEFKCEFETFFKKHDVIHPVTQVGRQKNLFKTSKKVTHFYLQQT